MKGINHLFEKFKSSAIEEIQKRTAVSEIIGKVIGQDVSINNIVFYGKVVKIKASQAMKNQILIKKQILMKSLKDKLDINDIQ